MPPRTKIYKEDVLKAAYDIAKVNGMEAVNARAIAESLNCSVQPIFHKFGSMEGLKQEVINEMVETYKSYMSASLDGERPYKQLGFNYIRFAKEEPVMFKIVCMSKSGLSARSYMEQDQDIISDIVKYGAAVTKLDEATITQFHFKMWIFTHGIATLMASRTCSLTDEEIGVLLQEEYEALMAIEQNKNKQ